MKYYYFAPRREFSGLAGVEHQCTHIGNLAFGWVDWSHDENLQKDFEARMGVVTLGPALAGGSISKEMATALSAHGVTAGDSRWDVVQKMAKKFGGFTVRH